MTDGTVTIKRVALVIGNSAYETAPLANPVNDARLMAKTLESTGFEVIEILDADRGKMLRAIRDFGKKLDEYGENTVGLFYFAGHGIQSGGVNYLIPVGANIQGEGDLDIDAVESQKLLRQMLLAKNETNIIILDACRNNPYRRSFRSSTPGLAKQSEDAPKGSLVAYSTAPGKVAADGDGDNSPYALALVKQMLIPGQGLLDVFANTAAMVVSQTGDKQVPWSNFSRLTNDSFHFTGTVTIDGTLTGRDKAPAGQVKTQQSEITFWQSVQNSGDIADIQAYLDTYPKGHYAILARNKIARLEKAPAGKPGAGSVNAPVIDKDTIFWQAIQNSKDPADYQAYLESYPGGGFATLAKKRFASLRKTETERERKAEAERNRKAEAERNRKTEAERRRKAEAERKRKAEAERKQKAEAERKRKAETEQKRKAEAEVKRTKTARRKELMESERKNPKAFWRDVTRRDAALLVSDTRPGNWPVFAFGDKDYDKDFSRLHLAALGRNEQAMRLLLEQGADINARKGNQFTPLHGAAYNGHDEVARLLLEKGADINAREEDQWTPLHLAAQNGHDQVARLLLGQGADINARTNKQYTPLHWAAQKGHDEVARVLLEQGADINARTGDQATPLHNAAFNGHDEVARLLLEQGADINARQEDQWTPLHWAAAKGHDEVARLLLGKGADIEARQKDQYTPLHLAAQNGHDEVARLLLGKGANIKARIKSGHTALDIAKHKGHTKLVELLQAKLRQAKRR